MMNIYDHKFANLGQRILAFLLDTAVLASLFFPLTRIFKGVWLMMPANHRWQKGLFITDPICIVFLLIGFLYFVLLEGYLGATVGKWLIGLRVVSLDGIKPGLWRALIRNLLRLVDGLPALNILGMVMIIYTKQNTRFGDHIAKTRVINIRS